MINATRVGLLQLAMKGGVLAHLPAILQLSYRSLLLEDLPSLLHQ